MGHSSSEPVPAGQLHHVEWNVADLEAATAFWDWLLTELGYERKDEWDGGRSWQHGPTYLVIEETPTSAQPFDRTTPGLNHLAFHARSREQVDMLTDEIRARSDATLLYPDQHPYAGGYYALYCEDPEGLKVEVVGPSGANHPSH